MVYGLQSQVFCIKVTAIKDLPTKLRQIKNIVQESPPEVYGAHVASFSFAMFALPNISNVGVTLLTGIVGISAAVYTYSIRHRGVYLDKFNKLFSSNLDAKKCTLAALEKLDLYIGESSPASLRQAMYVFDNMRTQQSQSGHDTEITVTPSGTNFYYMFSEDIETATSQIVKEALYAIMTDPGNANTLSEQGQLYLLQNYPDWVPLKPALFDKGLAKSIVPELLEAITAIKALDYKDSEQREALKLWISKHFEPCNPAVALPDFIT